MAKKKATKKTAAKPKAKAKAPKRATVRKTVKKAKPKAGPGKGAYNGSSELGEKLRAFRTKRGLSLPEAGALMRPPISAQAWSDVERGHRRSLDWIYAAAVGLGVSPQSLDPRLTKTAAVK
jgi:hypothetical protein